MESLNSQNKKRIFVVQSHFAKKHHWDFRLEMNGVLKSWAIPKTPSELKSKNKKVKRLAIQVDDHALSYADFEGEIKEGYGKGTVKIWDKGPYELISKDSKKIEFELHGKKLKGKFVLIKTNYGKSNEQKKKRWLIFRV